MLYFRLHYLQEYSKTCLKSLGRLLERAADQGQGKRGYKISAESATSNTQQVILPIGPVAKLFGICWKEALTRLP